MAKTERRQLNLCVWNVDGLKTKEIDKFKETNLLKHVGLYDIIGLVETHNITSFKSPLPKYKIYHNFRTQNEKSKRIFGGISVMVRRSISTGIKQLPLTNSNYMWFKLMKDYFSLNRDLYICFLHIPPENSTYSINEGDQFDNLVADIQNFHEIGDVTLFGDFNARVSVDADFISNDGSNKFEVDEYYIEDVPCIIRHSQDQFRCPRGKSLIDLCIGNRLRILNGRTLGDFSGKFTAHCSKGSSVIDYIIGSDCMLNRFLCMKVHDFQKSISNHCMLSCILSVNFKEIHVTETTQKYPLPLKYKWAEGSIIKFQEALSSPSVASKLENFISCNISFDKCGIEKAVEDVNNCILDAANISLKARKRVYKKRNLKKKKKWFTQDLHDMKTSLDYLSRQLAFRPFDNELRHKCFSLSKKYNKVRKERRRNYFRDIVNKMKTLSTKDPKEFWGIVNSLKNLETDNEEIPINPEQLLNHFKDLNKVSGKKSTISKYFNNVLKSIDVPDGVDILDKPITINEVSKACFKLKNNKSSGHDGILNEMLKYGQFALLPALNKLFNSILSSGIYPESWSKGIVIPIFKQGDRHDPGNYRGITITSCMGKVFNSIMNKRLEDFLKSNNGIADEQIGFKEGCRTSDHIFKLKTIIDRYLGKSKKLFTCFIDLKKAFDSVIHPALILKLAKIGIGGKYISAIQSMYKNIRLHVKINNDEMTEAFPSDVGVFQGDNLSPNLFNIFINDITKIFDSSCAPITIGSRLINSLLYADDLLLMSETEEGLQSSMNKVLEYCNEWGLDINFKKSKIMVFNKGSRVTTTKFYIGNSLIENVKQYKYLGVIFSINGSFNDALNDLYTRGQKAFFKLTNTFKNMPCDPAKFLYVFDHTVKPILLYASEIVGMFKPSSIENLFEKVYKLFPLEKLNLSLCRYILAVNNKTCKLALYGELGRYPMYIDVVLSMLKYWTRLKNNKTGDNLLSHALYENLKMVKSNQNCWLSSIQNILKKFNFYKLTDFDSEQPNSMQFKICNIKKIVKSMKIDFESNWHKKLQYSEKLRSYRKFKNTFKFEKYLTLINNENDRFNMSRYRTSNHRLQIELGRYTKPTTLIEDRKCKNCSSGEIEDEKHILMSCDKFSTLRKTYIDICYNKNIYSTNIDNKFIWLLSNEDANICQRVSKFLSLSIFIKKTK